MKKVVIGLVSILAAGAVLAAVSTNNTTYFPSYKLIPSSNTNSCSGVISTGVAYVVVAVTNIANGLTEAKASTTGDFRLFFYSFVQSAYEAIQAITSTNQPARLVLSRRVLNASSGDFKHQHTVETELTLDDDGTYSVTAE